MNRQGNFSVGGPSRPSNQNQNRNKQGMRPYHRSQNNRGVNHPTNQKWTCFKCGQDGHLSNECRNTTSVCYNCKKPGHFARDCKAPQAGPSANTTHGARPTAKGRVYCMGTE
ncbi:TIR-NBS-LRR resistance protein, partial [Trifolium medium]|nr:TIR-NBS-LRR resistance protein [Trifolium medium]